VPAPRIASALSTDVIIIGIQNLEYLHYVVKINFKSGAVELIMSKIFANENIGKKCPVSSIGRAFGFYVHTFKPPKGCGIETRIGQGFWS
jgi:hypothetical protein